MMNTNLNFIRYSIVAILLLGLIFGQSGWLINSFAENASVTEINQNQSPEQVQKSMGSLPVYFEENRGQHNAQVRYLTRGGGTSMFLTATEAVYVLGSRKSKVESRTSDDENNERQRSTDKPPAEKAVALYMRLAGANPNAEFVGQEQLAHRTNYFRGADALQWQTEIPNYRRVVAENIYDGVDMVWQGKEQGAIQYDFVVAPNANPTRIEWEIEGAENVSIDADGSLLIETEVGVMKQRKPFSFQDTADNLRQEVGSRWSVVSRKTIANETSFAVSFEVGAYDHTKTLTIDPTVMFSGLEFSTFLGGADTDRGNAIAVDSANNVYVTGTTTSTTFPTVAGGFDTTHNGNFDVFVSKLNAAGSALIYSTFLGGNQLDEGLDIAVDSAGNAYLTGFTSDGTTDYPTTAGAFDTTHNGGNDAFATKLNATGSALIYSTFLGGSAGDFGNGIAVDSAENAYLTGNTFDGTTDYPTTAGAFDTIHNGLNDAFATKLNATGSALTFSTFLGGNNNDIGNAIAVDSAENAYLTGFTSDGTIEYPRTAGAFDITHNGSNDAFATKLNATGSALVYSTLLGGGGSDSGNGIAVDSTGNAYLTGNTDDGTNKYPTTAGAFGTTHNGNIDAFATKLNTTGSALVYSTFLGGTANDAGRDIAVDSAGNAYLTGFTSDGNPDYPTTAGAFDTIHNGGDDAFATKLNATGSALTFSTFLGGSAGDFANGIAIDSAGNAYLTGTTFDGTTDYPTTAGAFDTTHNGVSVSDAFVTKLNDAPPTPNSPPTANPDGYSTDEDTPLNEAAPGVLGNDSDPNAGDTITAVLVSGPTNAQSFTLNADGSFSYTPAANFNGNDSFSYTARDNSNADSSPVTVTITVNPVNNAPTISGATVSRQQGTAGTASTIATVMDVDNTAGSLTVTTTSVPAGITVTDITTTGGTITATVTATCNAALGNNTVGLQVSDGNLTATANLTVNVTVGITPPVINPIANIVVNLPANSNATSTAVSFPLPTATGNCGGAVTVTTNPVSGSQFNVGTTTVNVTATDAVGNQAMSSFTVTVRYRFRFNTFFSPLREDRLNLVDAGSDVSIIFSLSGFKGASVYRAPPASQRINCSTRTLIGAIQPIDTTVNYDPIYNAGFDIYSTTWQTRPAWTGTCRRLFLYLNDGTTQTLDFHFR